MDYGEWPWSFQCSIRIPINQRLSRPLCDRDWFLQLFILRESRCEIVLPHTDCYNGHRHNILYIYFSNCWLPSQVLAVNILSHGTCPSKKAAAIIPARFNETALDNSELLTPKLSNSFRQNCGLLQSGKERDRNWGFHFRYSWQLLPQMGVPFSYIKSAISWPDGVSLFHQDWG